MSEIRITNSECLACKSAIVEKIVSEFDPMSGPLIFGPGSRQQFRKVSKGFYCKQCGLKYEFAPQLNSTQQ